MALFVIVSALRANDDSRKAPTARLALSEDWSTGKINPAKWYLLRKKWGQDNNGVVPENVWIERDTIQNRPQNVLVCQALGDRYDGKITGLHAEKTRVGGVIVSKSFFASGRFEVVMRIGDVHRHDDFPSEPTRPCGAVPAIWTYGNRFVSVPPQHRRDFMRDVPLYNPLMELYGNGSNEYTSEIDFPEFGKDGIFERAMYNAYCQTGENSQTFDVSQAIDGKYHTYTTEWHTTLQDFPRVTDAQVVNSEGFWWMSDKSIPFDRYLGNPLKRLAKDRYAIHRGDICTHWIDGKKVGETTKCVSAMAAQLNLGVWLPKWAGPAPWKTAQVRFASIRVWQFDEPGDVRGIITSDIPDSFEKGR